MSSDRITEEKVENPDNIEQVEDYCSQIDEEKSRTLAVVRAFIANIGISTIVPIVTITTDTIIKNTRNTSVINGTTMMMTMMTTGTMINFTQNTYQNEKDFIFSSLFFDACWQYLCTKGKTSNRIRFKLWNRN